MNFVYFYIYAIHFLQKQNHLQKNPTFPINKNIKYFLCSRTCLQVLNLVSLIYVWVYIS